MNVYQATNTKNVVEKLTIQEGLAAGVEKNREVAPWQQGGKLLVWSPCCPRAAWWDTLYGCLRTRISRDPGNSGTPHITFTFRYSHLLSRRGLTFPKSFGNRFSKRRQGAHKLRRRALSANQRDGAGRAQPVSVVPNPRLKILKPINEWVVL